jgi:hypothetical protein
VTGSYDEVMESFDRRTYSEIRLAHEGQEFLGQDTLKLDLRRYQGRVPEPAEALGDVFFPFGAYLVIKSTDPNWAMQAFAQLSNEVDKGQPWWRWIHTIVGSFMLCKLAHQMKRCGPIRTSPQHQQPRIRLRISSDG